jgi:heme-degrading monooxygenase HmoA
VLLNGTVVVSKPLPGSSSRSTFEVDVTAWSQGLEVSGDGTGIVSHAGIGLLRHLADKTRLTRGLSAALASGRLVHHDRGRVLADVACAIADGARGFSDFRVLADQGELFGQVASVLTVYRTLEEIAGGGDRTADQAQRAHDRRRLNYANLYPHIMLMQLMNRQLAVQPPRPAYCSHQPGR